MTFHELYVENLGLLGVKISINGKVRLIGAEEFFAEHLKVSFLCLINWKHAIALLIFVYFET